MPQNFSRTLTDRRRQGQAAGRGPSPPPALPALSPALGSAAPGAGPAAPAPPAVPPARGSAPSARRGAPATAGAGAGSCCKTSCRETGKGSGLCAHVCQRLELLEGIWTLSPTAASSVSCLRLPEVKRSSGLYPGKRDPENFTLRSFQRSLQKTHRWHSPLQGAFPIFSPATCHHGKLPPEIFSISLTLSCKVILLDSLGCFPEG